MGVFEDNLRVIECNNKFLYKALKQIDANDKYEVFYDKNSPSDTNIVHKNNFIPMYKDKASKKIVSQLKDIKYTEKYPYLYIFGIANGVFVKELLQNSKHKRIFVVEPELELLYIALNLIDFSTQIEQKRLVFISKEEINFSRLISMFGKDDIKYYARLYDMFINTEFYEECFSGLITTTNRTFIECLHHQVQLVGNDAKDALIGVEHHFMNLPLLLKTPSLYEFFKQAKTTKVAILVSTGPSLTKQLPLLKQIAPYVTIFAVDASFPVLRKFGIKPDVVVSMERVPLTGRFFKDTSREDHEDVIFALSSLQHPEVVNSLKAGTMQMSMRPFGYMMQTGPQQWGHVGIGMSAANMAYELIYHSKFETCILIGQDLAYGKDGVSHASAHILGESSVPHQDGDGWTECYGGGAQVKTTAIWNMFRRSFEADIEETKATMDTINSTEGGAKINGAIEIPFSKIVNSIVDKSKIKKQIKLNSVKKSDLKKIQREVKKRVESITKYITEQKNSTQSLFLECAKACEGDNLKNKTSVLEKIEKFKNQTQKKEFEQIIGFVASPIVFPQELILAQLHVENLESDVDRKENTKELLECYKEWLFKLAGCIDAIGVAMTRKGSHYE